MHWKDQAEFWLSFLQFLLDLFYKKKLIKRAWKILSAVFRRNSATFVSDIFCNKTDFKWRNRRKIGKILENFRFKNSFLYFSMLFILKITSKRNKSRWRFFVATPKNLWNHLKINLISKNPINAFIFYLKWASKKTC